MADEASIVCSLSFTKNSMTEPVKVGGPFTVTVSGNVVSSGVVSVGTSAEAVPVGEVTSPGYLWVHNLDSTNYVKIRVSTGATVYFSRVLAGKQAVIPLDPTDAAAPYWLANSSACLVHFVLLSA